MRHDIILEFCEGKKPKELISKGTNRATVYKYYRVYRNMKEELKKEETLNKLVKVLVNIIGKH